MHSLQLEERRELAQEFRLGGRVAIFHGGDRRHPRFGLLKEGEEIDDATDVHAGREKLRILREAGHRHVATVGCAHDAQATGRGDSFLPKKLHATFDVAPAVETQGAVVQVDEFFAKASRTTHIGVEDVDPLGEQRLKVVAIAGQRLPFRAAVKMDDGGARKGRSRFVQPAAQFEAIVRGEMHQTRLDQRLRVDSFVWAVRAALAVATFRIIEPDIARQIRSGTMDGQLTTVLSITQGQSQLGRQRDGRRLLAGQVEDFHSAAAAAAPAERSLCSLG